MALIVIAFAISLLVQAGPVVGIPPGDQAPRAAAAVDSRPAALVQAGNSKTTCIDVPYIHYNLRASLKAVETNTHVDYNCLLTYSDADVTWSAWVDPWLTQARYGYREWLRAKPRLRTIVITQNLVPDVVDHQPDWAATCASGAYRPYGVQLARHLVRAGFAYSVVRLGPEMNGNWYYDSLGNDPSSWRQWAQCFAQVVDAMRSVRGEHFLFDWNVNAGYRVIPLSEFYPGNAYVDIVGIDAYDDTPAGPLPPVGSPARWRALASEPLGLYALYRFAQAHHKPLSIPEWGTVDTAHHGGGDDPGYVKAMGTFIATHDVAYESWFDSGSGVLQLSETGAPHSLAAYIQAFGPGSPIGRYQQAATGS